MRRADGAPPRMATGAALNGGERQPETPEEARFVGVRRGRAAPETEHEIASTEYVRPMMAQRDAEAARRAADIEARQNATEE